MIQLTVLKEVHAKKPRDMQSIDFSESKYNFLQLRIKEHKNKLDYLHDAIN